MPGSIRSAVTLASALLVTLSASIPLSHASDAPQGKEKADQSRLVPVVSSVATAPAPKAAAAAGKTGAVATAPAMPVWKGPWGPHH